MIDRSFVDNYANKWTRISKSKARKAYDNGERVLMIPCKLNPSSPMACYAITEKEEPSFSFDRAADAYAYWNCNHENGYYLSFYVTSGPAITIRAAMFSCGVAGYVTADTIEVTINGYRIRNHEFMEELGQLVAGINRGTRSREFIHRVLDPVAASLVGRVAW